MASNIAYLELGVAILMSFNLFSQILTSIIVVHYGILGAKVIKFRIIKLIPLVLIVSEIILMGWNK
jgi:transporter family-2 protein